MNAKLMYVMSGVEMIARCDVSSVELMEWENFIALRLMDNFARVALSYGEKTEEYVEAVLLLNVMIVGAMRECLEGVHGVHLQNNYAFALKLKEVAAKLRRKYVMELKGIEEKESFPEK